MHALVNPSFSSRLIEEERQCERMIGRETIVEEGRCGNNKRESERLKGSKRKQNVMEEKGFLEARQ